MAYSTVSTALSSASSLVILSLSAKCMSETPRYAATHRAPQPMDTSMSSLRGPAVGDDVCGKPLLYDGPCGLPVVRRYHRRDLYLVHAKVVQHPRDLYPLLVGERDSRVLLPLPQGCCLGCVSSWAPRRPRCTCRHSGSVPMQNSVDGHRNINILYEYRCDCGLKCTNFVVTWMRHLGYSVARMHPIRRKF